MRCAERIFVEPPAGKTSVHDGIDRISRENPAGQGLAAVDVAIASRMTPLVYAALHFGTAEFRRTIVDGLRSQGRRRIPSRAGIRPVEQRRRRRPSAGEEARTRAAARPGADNDQSWSGRLPWARRQDARRDWHPALPRRRWTSAPSSTCGGVSGGIGRAARMFRNPSARWRRVRRNGQCVWRRRRAGTLSGERLYREQYLLGGRRDLVIDRERDAGRRDRRERQPVGDAVGRRLRRLRCGGLGADGPAVGAAGSVPTQRPPPDGRGSSAVPRRRPW